MTSQTPREELEFVEGVTELFRFLETEYGYRQTHSDPTLVVYESRRMDVNIRHGLLSYEVEFNILRRRWRRKTWYGLPEILEGLAPEYKGGSFYQTSGKHLLRQSLASIAELIRTYASPLLGGADEAVRLVETARRKGEERMTEHYAIRPVKDRAHDAWRERDFERVVALYTSIESHLSSLERRQLDYAKERSMKRHGDSHLSE